MSFSAEVKKELARIVPPASHCRRVSVAVFSLYLPEEERKDALSKYFTLKKKNTNIMSAPEDIEGNRVADSLLRHACCKKSFLRESFLLIGSVSDPKGEYHLEFNCPDKAQAQQLIEVLSDFSVSGRMVERRKGYGVYIKDSAAILDVLNLMGAHKSLMEMENSLILKEMRNSINRRVNCETANLEKTVSAALRQQEDIRFLKESGAYQTLPESLKEIADVRMQLPDASLKELGEALNPTVGKSGVNHRLRKLSQIADELRGQMP